MKLISCKAAVQLFVNRSMQTELANLMDIGPLSEEDKAALVRLLSDPDQDVYRSIRLVLLNCGMDARSSLRLGLDSDDRLVRQRSWKLISFLDRKSADVDFISFCKRGGENLNLEKGVWSLVKTTFPHIDQASYQKILEGYADRVRKYCDPQQSFPATLMAINRVFFNEEGFHGDKKNYYDPQNSYLNRVIDRKFGNPISLCLLYLFIAKRLSLPLVGVAMPGHFILRLQSSTFNIFVDPFNMGNFLTQSQCEDRLKLCGFGFESEFLFPVSPRRILLRICSNLHQIYQKAKRFDERDRIQKYLINLAN